MARGIMVSSLLVKTGLRNHQKNGGHLKNMRRYQDDSHNKGRPATNPIALEETVSVSVIVA